MTLSGDVHHAYLSEVAFKRDAGVKSAVYQAVCSPMRNPLDSRERRAIKALFTRPVAAVTRAAGSPRRRVRPLRSAGAGWAAGPYFDNQLATLEVDGRRIDLSIEKAVPGDDEPQLDCVQETRLA